MYSPRYGLQMAEWIRLATKRRRLWGEKTNSGEVESRARPTVCRRDIIIGMGRLFHGWKETYVPDAHTFGLRMGGKSFASGRTRVKAFNLSSDCLIDLALGPWSMFIQASLVRLCVWQNAFWPVLNGYQTTHYLVMIMDWSMNIHIILYSKHIYNIPGCKDAIQ